MVWKLNLKTKKNMRRFEIEMNYNVSLNVEVEAENELEAFDKGRLIAEETDMRDFSFNGENNHRILSSN